MTRPSHSGCSLPLMPATAGAFDLDVPATAPPWRDDRAGRPTTLARRGRAPLRAVSAADGHELAFAGLWEEWRGPESPPLLSCTILVGTANDLVAPIHDRMAVILGADDYATWFDPAQAGT